MGCDLRDVVIEHLAADVAALSARLADVAADRDLYRDMLQLTLQHLYALQSQHRRLRARHHSHDDETEAA